MDLSSCAANEWLIVLDLEGNVSAVEGGPPLSWIGGRYDACAGLPEDVCDAARKLVQESARAAPLPVLRAARLSSKTMPDVAFTLVTARAIFIAPAHVEIERLIRDVLEPLTKQARSSFVSLAFEADPAGPRKVVIDANKIAWALATLIGSALRHVERGTPEKPGGHVHVRLRYNPLDSRIVITVEDDGHGIQAGVRAWLFEPKPDTGVSAGVALRLVDQVVTAHGGRMVIHTPLDPRAGRGTDVTIWLPAGT